MMAIGTGIMSAALYRRRSGHILNPATAAWIARMEVAPDSVLPGLAAELDIFVRALEAVDYWQASDAIWIPALHSRQAALLNAVSAAYPLVEVNSPTWTQFFGATGYSGTQYLTSVLNPSAVTNFSQNNAALSVYVPNNVSADARYVEAAANLNLLARLAIFPGSMQAYLNSSTYVRVALPSATSLGLLTVSRSSAATINLHKNGPAFASPAAASSAVGSATMSFLKTGAPAGGISASYWRIGAAVTADQEAAAYAALLRLFSFMGVPV